MGLFGGILSAFGKTKDRAARTEEKSSGFDSLSPEIRDYMMKTILPRLQEYTTSKYQGLPRRALNTQDTDPLFGSSGRVAYAGQVGDLINAKKAGL